MLERFDLTRQRPGIPAKACNDENRESNQPQTLLKILKQSCQSNTWVRLSHEGLTDQESINTVCMHQFDIFRL